MSLAINVTTPDGMVLASDSRQTYINRKGQARIGSDSASKLFKLTPKIGVSVVGPAFLVENGVQKNMAYFIDKFVSDIKKSQENPLVEDIAKKLQIYFNNIFEWKKDLELVEVQLKEQVNRQGGKEVSVKQDGSVIIVTYNLNGESKTITANINTIQLFVAGYNPNGTYQVLIVSIPGNIDEKRNSIKMGSEFGASWIGQIDVVTRIVLGFDPRIGGLPFVGKAIQEGQKNELENQLRQLEYSIQWGTMTLQDSIDFANLMIETTSAMQRFSDGIIADPGDIPGVGGPIDLAIITRKKGFLWVSRKGLKLNDELINLDNIEDVSEIKDKSLIREENSSIEVRDKLVKNEK